MKNGKNTFVIAASRAVWASLLTCVCLFAGCTAAAQTGESSVARKRLGNGIVEGQQEPQRGGARVPMIAGDFKIGEDTLAGNFEPCPEAPDCGMAGKPFPDPKPKKDAKPIDCKKDLDKCRIKCKDRADTDCKKKGCVCLIFSRLNEHERKKLHAEDAKKQETWRSPLAPRETDGSVLYEATKEYKCFCIKKRT